jgi:alanine racemase
MGRCGVRWDDEPSLRSCFTPQLEGAFTHFYAADDRPESVELQWQRFEQALTVFPRRPALVHAANSAGAWRLSTPQDLVRPGIYLYGSRHAPDLPAPRPVAAVRARVVSLRTIPAGDSVSYGGEWIAPQETRVATLGIGYADGVFRSVQGRGQVLLGGRRRPIVGRITMDFLMVALADEDAVEVGDIATLVGRDGDAEITIDEFAAWAGTNGYEALARLGARLPRRYA